MKLIRLLSMWCLCGAVAILAQPAAMSSLQNLPEVGVRVRGLSPDGAKLGLTESELVATVRKALETAGVKIVPPPVLDREPDTPVVEISANLNQVSRTGFLFVLDLQLWEPAQPVRKLKTLVKIPVATWAAQDCGYTAKAEKVRDSLAAMAEQFATEWRPAQQVAP